MFWAGCVSPARVGRLSSAGHFSLTDSPGSVYWGDRQNAATNEIRFIFTLPETAEMHGGGQSHGNVSYEYCTLKLKHNDHQWKIEGYKNFKTGIRWLRITDLTARTSSNVNLDQSRFWQVSEDGTLTPLDRLDEAISERVVRESQALYALSASRSRTPAR